MLGFLIFSGEFLGLNKHNFSDEKWMVWRITVLRHLLTNVRCFFWFSSSEASGLEDWRILEYYKIKNFIYRFFSPESREAPPLRRSGDLTGWALKSSFFLSTDFVFLSRDFSASSVRPLLTCWRKPILGFDATGASGPDSEEGTRTSAGGSSGFGKLLREAWASTLISFLASILISGAFFFSKTCQF